jgi:hypothetical protein
LGTICLQLRWLGMSECYASVFTTIPYYGIGRASAEELMFICQED